MAEGHTKTCTWMLGTALIIVTKTRPQQHALKKVNGCRNHGTFREQSTIGAYKTCTIKCEKTREIGRTLLSEGSPPPWDSSTVALWMDRATEAVKWSVVGVGRGKELEQGQFWGQWCDVIHTYRYTLSGTHRTCKTKSGPGASMGLERGLCGHCFTICNRGTTVVGRVWVCGDVGFMGNLHFLLNFALNLKLL